MNIYVGNISYQMSESELREQFEQFGAVEKVKIVTDRDTGRSKGFGFVEMSSHEDGKKALEGLNGAEVLGRTIKVSEAREREQRETSYRKPRY